MSQIKYCHFFCCSINTPITAVRGIPLLCFPHLFSQLKVIELCMTAWMRRGAGKLFDCIYQKMSRGDSQKHCLTSLTSPEQGDESPSHPPTYVHYTSTMCTQQLLLPLPAFVHLLFPCLPLRSGHSIVASRLRDVILADGSFSREKEKRAGTGSRGGK